MNDCRRMKNIYSKLNKLRALDNKDDFKSEGESDRYKILNNAISANFNFMIINLMEQHEYEPLKMLAQMDLVSRCLEEPIFIRLLVKCCLTNRIIEACHNQNIPAPLKSRIRECMTAFKTYY